MLKTLVIVLAVIVVLVLAAAGVGYYFLTQPSDIEQEMASVTVSDEAARSLDDKIEDFDDRLESASTGESLSLILTDDEVTSKLVQELSRGEVDLPVDIENPRVRFGDGKVFASADVEISGFHTTLGAEARVQAQDDELKLTIGEINLGRLPLPDAVLDRIKGELVPEEEMVIDMDEWGITMNIEDIRIEEGQVILEGVAR